MNKPNRNIPNIILFGLCGSGKSSIGVSLSQRLGYGFLDLDDWIEKSEKKSVLDIFNEKGEKYFRRKEMEAISAIKSINSHVISLGGGALLGEQNWRVISSLGISIWINVPPTRISKRLVKNQEELKKRPLLADLLEEELVEIREQKLLKRLGLQLSSRQERFAEASIIYSDSYASSDEAARRIKQLVDDCHYRKNFKRRNTKDKLRNKETRQEGP